MVLLLLSGLSENRVCMCVPDRGEPFAKCGFRGDVYGSNGTPEARLLALGVWAATIAIFWCVCVYHIYTTRCALVYVFVCFLLVLRGCFVFYFMFYLFLLGCFECQWPMSRGVGELRLASHPTV